MAGRRRCSLVPLTRAWSVAMLLAFAVATARVQILGTLGTDIETS